MKHKIRAVLSMLVVLGVAQAAFAIQRVPVLDACEGCEAVFDGIPEVLESHARIAPPGGPGEPMTLAGRVLDHVGKPQPGVIVYAYQTDQAGIYPPANTRHGRLRGWVRADAGGRYRFDTIRPGSYPDSDIPQHIHMHVIEPGCSTYYIDDVMFQDDPKLTPRQVRQLSQARGGSGLVTPRMVDGTWQVERDIVLGRGISGYKPCRVD